MEDEQVTMSGTFYLLVCRDCGDGDLVMPFDSAAERGKWAAGHTRATGHERWFVRDVTSDEMTARTPKSPGPATPLRAAEPGLR